MSDDYVLETSLENQEAGASKMSQHYYIRQPDTNGGSYASGQINWNLPSFSTQDAYLSLKDSFLEIPYQITLDSDIDFDTSAKNTFACGLKGGFHQLVHSLSVTLDNNQVLNFTEFTNIPMQFKIMSKFSQDDVNNLADTIDFAMDNETALGYNTVYGEHNNVIKPVDFDPATGYETAQINGGLLKRMMKTSYDPSATEEAKFTNEALTLIKKRSYYIRKTAKQLQYNIMVILPLKFVAVDLFEKIPLIKGAFLRMTLNMHQCKTTWNSSQAGAITAVTPTSQFGVAPAIVAPFQAGLGQTANAGVYTLQCGIVKTPSSTDTPLGNVCNFVGSFYKMTPKTEEMYLSSSPVKTISYTETAYNSLLGVNPSQSIIFQVNNSVSKPRWLLIHMALAGKINGSANATDTVFASGNATAFSTLESPFSSSPATTVKNASMTSFNVKVGGVNLYTQNNVSYTYEMYLNEIRSAGAIQGGHELGLSSGILSEKKWSSGYGYIFVDLSRNETIARDVMPRSIEIVGTNNTLNMVDIRAWIGYEKQIDLNVSTGKVQIL